MYSAKELSEKVNDLSRNSADNLLEIGLTFLDAKKHLSKDEHQQFLSETHYVENSSAVRKWECIGQAYVRLKSISQLLPPVFTTLYQLSQLNADQLDVLIKNKVLNPSVSSKEINAELHPHTKSSKIAKLTISFNAYATAEIVHQVNDFLTAYASYLEIKMNDKTQDLIEIATSQSCNLKKIA